MKNSVTMKWALVGLALTFSTGLYAQALYIAPTGDVGIGTELPISSLEITRDDGTAQVLVNETSVEAAPRTLFQLRNPGNTKCGVFNPDADVQWSFANPGSGFRLSRQGSGVVEMEITNDGNLIIAGLLTEESDVNSKSNIVEVKPAEVLEAVASLPVSRWEYKDSPGEVHMGPMAQDFHAAFGLGATDTGISTLETSGVALAAIKALIEENRQLKSQMQEMQERYEDVEELVGQILENQAQDIMLVRTETN